MQLQIRRRLAKLEFEKFAAEGERERRAQASQVACWVDSARLAEGGRGPTLHLLNGGSQPIFQVHVFVRPHYQTYTPAGASEVGGHFLGSLGPGAEAHWDIQICADQQEVFIASGSLPVEVAFLDVSRRQWRRTVQGELEELKELLGGFC